MKKTFLSVFVSFVLIAAAHAQTGSSADTIGPSVSMTYPSANSTVSGQITLSAYANDNAGVRRVRFIINGSQVGEANAPASSGSSNYSYTAPWNSASVPNGPHKAKALAEDMSGNITSSGEILFNVNNQNSTAPATTADTAPPSIYIAKPVAGSTVSGTSVEVVASVSDNGPIAGVQFKIDNANYGAFDSTSPYSIIWNTASFGNGGHNVSAIAKDAAGNESHAAVSVNVYNQATTTEPAGTTEPTPTTTSGPSDSTPPSLSITSPAPDSSVSGEIIISASASDNVGISGGVQFKIDGGSLGRDYTASSSNSYSIQWRTNNYPNGPHKIEVVARDSAGNQTNSSINVTVSNVAATATNEPTTASTAPSTTSSTTEPAPQPTATNTGAATASPIPSRPYLQVVSSTEINLSWGVPSNAGIVGYIVFRGGEKIADVTTNNYSDSGLKPSTQYSYRISSYDSAGTISPKGESASATTKAEIVANKTIKGRIAFSDGSPAPDGEIGAYSPETTNWAKGTVSSDGSYSIAVGPGKWMVKLRPLASASWRWNEAPREVNFSGASGEEAVINFTIQIAAAELSVKTLDQNDRPISAGVIVDTVSSSNVRTGESSSALFGKSDASGNVRFQVGAGTFYVRAHLPQGSGVIGPNEETVVISEGGEKSITLRFKSAELFIKGKVRYSSGIPAQALVWAWSDKGGSVQTHADANGLFSLPVVANSRWHLGAGKLDGESGYKSSESVFDIASAGIDNLDIVVLPVEDVLARRVTVQKEASETTVASLDDGAKVELPSDAVSDSGEITLDVKPTVEAPVQPLAKVIGSTYDVTVKDSSGELVKTFSKEIELTFPYDDATLKDLGITEDQLAPSYYDENTGTWVKLTNYFIDKVNKRVVAKVDHLTRFALVGAADVTPPAAPSLLFASSSPAGVLLSWTNPLTDFRHAKVYRSTELGNIGSVIFPEVSASTATDSTISPGSKYYYVVRAVDPAGNESVNTNQVSVAASASAGTTVPYFGRTLKLGSQGIDTGLLQRVLARDGVYPEGIVSNYFGKLTLAAVIKFQEKYRAEILAPAGLTAPTGVVGPLTRTKLIQLQKQYSL